jgi:formylglycine-generating enzyme
MRRALLLTAALASAGFEAPTGRAVVARRPIEAQIGIPGGVFRMGATKEGLTAAVQLCREEIGTSQERACQPEVFASEGPDRRVFLGPFAIDRVEVTVGAYRACVQAGGCAPQPLLQPDERFLVPTVPVTSITWGEAARYCAFSGGRLPTEAEWERAARGRDGRTWPWGNIPKATAANHGRFLTVQELSPNPYTVLQSDPSDGFAFLAPVGSFPSGASSDGVLDLAGNAMEWTADVYNELPPQQKTTVNPRGPQEGSLRVVRGGSWRQPRIFQRTTARDGVSPDTRSPEIGFRCAR